MASGSASGRAGRRRALVTGGASGIGQATANRLRAEGADVAVLDRRPAPPAAALLGERWVQCDVTAPEQVADAVRAAASLLGGPPDLLVNAAGIYRIAPLLDIGAQDWDEVLAVNLRGTFLVGREVAAALIEAGAPGSIVNIASTAALVADAAEPTAHYNASKAGVVALTKQMAVEWAVHGIRANAVCPGVIDTPMLALMDDPASGQAYLQAGVPLRRLGRADEVAAAIAFLASDDASYLTGAIVPVDGGSTAL